MANIRAPYTVVVSYYYEIFQGIFMFVSDFAARFSFDIFLFFFRYFFYYLKIKVKIFSVYLYYSVFNYYKLKWYEFYIT
jgi:hypothetical protein